MSPNISTVQMHSVPSVHGSDLCKSPLYSNIHVAIPSYRTLFPEDISVSSWSPSHPPNPNPKSQQRKGNRCGKIHPPELRNDKYRPASAIRVECEEISPKQATNKCCWEVEHRQSCNCLHGGAVTSSLVCDIRTFFGNLETCDTVSICCEIVDLVQRWISYADSPRLTGILQE